MKDYNHAERLRQLAEHYAAMLQNPATEAHARWIIERMAKDRSGIYVDLPRMIDEIQEQKNRS